MNLLIISDLHIDTGDKLGIFQWNDDEFIGCIEKFRELYSVNKIILNGDIFELLKYSFYEIRKARPLLVRYLLNSKFIILKGNHDILNTIGKEFYRITNSSGQVIHIEHGHNADWLNGNFLGRLLGQFIFFLLKRMSNIKYMTELYFNILKRNEGISVIPKKYNTLNYLTYALRKLKECDVLILGHTHKLESHHTYYMNRKKRYINCGSCSLGRFEGIILNTETLEYDLIKETIESLRKSNSMTYAG
ncbi:MAG: metallophosphoesterase [Bacteroidales bacterium]